MLGHRLPPPAELAGGQNRKTFETGFCLPSQRSRAPRLMCKRWAAGGLDRLLMPQWHSVAKQQQKALCACWLESVAFAPDVKLPLLGGRAGRQTCFMPAALIVLCILDALTYDCIAVCACMYITHCDDAGWSDSV